jgi:2-dehydro-3-deoxygluconokinase
MIELRDPSTCQYDLIALGEVMIRLDPGSGRIRTARRFDVWEGGGEYNVARGLRRCFGLRTGVVTALVRNEIGLLVEDLILQGGVDTSLIRWVPSDGVGRSVRNGINFTERGFGVRGAVGVSDRGHTAASQIRPGDIDWDDLFGNRGVRWLHTGGIYAALSEDTAGVVVEAITAARRHGTVVSYDLNYRPSLWQAIGGTSQAQQVNRAIVAGVDVIVGNEEDYTAALGFDIPDTHASLTALDPGNFEKMITAVTSAYPNISVAAATLRTARTATVNDWAAVAWSRQDGFVRSAERQGLEIFDRVGGGDSFASGLIYGILAGRDLQASVDYGAAHGALAMTTPGDTSMASLADVEALIRGTGARVVRLSARRPPLSVVEAAFGDVVLASTPDRVDRNERGARAWGIRERPFSSSSESRVNDCSRGGVKLPLATDDAPPIVRRQQRLNLLPLPIREHRCREAVGRTRPGTPDMGETPMVASPVRDCSSLCGLYRTCCGTRFAVQEWPLDALVIFSAQNGTYRRHAAVLSSVASHRDGTGVLPRGAAPARTLHGRGRARAAFRGRRDDTPRRMDDLRQYSGNRSGPAVLRPGARIRQGSR